MVNNWENLPTKYKIYRYASLGYSQDFIAHSLLKIDKGYVSRTVNNFVKDGYLKIVYDKYLVKGKYVYKKTRPILYAPTDKNLSLYKLKLSKSGRGPNLVNKKLDPRIDLLSLKYEIVKPNEIPYDGKRSDLNNGNFQIDIKELFPGGLITFRVFNDSMLIVFLPSGPVERDSIRGIPDKAYKEAMHYVNWFQRTYKCRVSEFPSVYRAPEYAFEENDPLLCDMVKDHGMLRIVDQQGNVVSWWDQSKGAPEYETKDQRVAEAKAFAPEKIVWLEDQVNDLKKSIDEMNRGIREISDNIRELKDLFSVPEDRAPRPWDVRIYS